MSSEYDLPTGPRELFDASYRTLARYMGEDNIRLGGGTALVARWQHRHSTDVDLFVPRNAYLELVEHVDEIREAFNTAVNDQSLSVEHCVFRFNEGEVSVSSTSPVTDDPASSDTVRGTRVALETSREILAKKLRYRMLGTEEFLPRDVFDIASARRFDRQALQAAFDTLTRWDRVNLLNNLSHLPARWMDNHPSRVLAPTRSQDLRTALTATRRLLKESLDRAVERGMDR